MDKIWTSRTPWYFSRTTPGYAHPTLGTVALEMKHVWYLWKSVFTREREDPDDEDDDDDPAVGQVVVARVRIDDGAPAVDGDDDDGEGRDENVGACKNRNKC